MAGGVLLLSYLANRERVTTTESFTGITEVVFDVENSPVVVIGGDDETVVDMSITTGFLGGKATLEQDGAILRIEQRCPPVFGWGCEASFEVSVPEATSVVGSTANGPVAVESVTGAVDVAASNGAITLDDLSAGVVARTSNGAVIGTALSSEWIEVSTSNGSVALEFEEPPESVRATTSNGRVQVVLPSDAPAYALDTTTSNGQVNAVIRTDPSAPATIDIATSNADIEIFYG